MVDGISGTGAGSGADVGDEENDGRLVLLHAPKSIASAEASPRLAVSRALREPTMSPPSISAFVPQPSAPAKRKTRDGAMMSGKIRRHPVSDHPTSASPRP